MLTYFQNQPWPNLVVEIAYSEDEARVKNKVEGYWLSPGRAHDVIMIKLDYRPGVVPTCMTVSNNMVQFPLNFGTEQFYS